MSRTGKKPIPVADSVEVKIQDNRIRVKGPAGELVREIPRDMIIEQGGGQITVKRLTDSKRHRAMHGLTRTLISNMVEGVTEGFSKTLELVGVGYRVVKQGEKVVLTIGYSHPVIFEPEKNLKVEVSGNNKIIVSGIDKQQVGNFAARIRRVYPPEPYKGKGIKYENERIRRKVGKAGK